MAYNTEKLAKLAALKALAEKIKSDYTKKTDFDALSGKVDQLVDAGGEPNILNGVKVNGTALAIADKLVNILIATGTANGTLSVNNVDVAVKGLATLAYKAKVSESDLDAALKAVLDAKAANTDLTALKELVGTLPEGATATTVIGYVSEEVAKIVNGAPEAYDTLKEISDWIGNNPNGAAAMNTAIQNNADAITKLTNFVGELPEGTQATTVVGYVAEAIAAIGIGDYAKVEALNKVIERVDALEGNTHTHANKSVLDGITAELITAWNGAVTAQHEHSNKTVLDKVTQAMLDKLDGISANAKKVEASATNGNVKIDGVETKVYTEPADVVHGSIASDTEVSEMLSEVFAAE